MNAALGDGGIRALTDSIGGLLKNPAVIQGIIAAISAISASSKTKKPNDGAEGQADGAAGLDIGSIIGMLPQLLPLISAFTPQPPADPAGGTDEGAPPALPDGANADDGDDDAVSASALFDGAESRAVSIAASDRGTQRENLLLAIKPYLSPSRQSAADAIIKVNRLSGMLGGRAQ